MANVDAILTDIKNNKFAPVYFLQGEEPFFIDQISGYIERNALDEAAKGFNQVVLYGKDVNMTDIISHARRFPMMSERQVVIIKEAQSLQDLKNEAGQKLLSGYLNEPQPSTILVFCHKHKKIDRRRSLGKELEQKAIFVDTKKLYENQVPEWIQKYTKQQGFEITDKAAFLMSGYIGNDLERIANELKKIIINFKEKTTIDDGHVHKFIGISKDYNVFELQKALAYKDVYKANNIINYFADNPRNNPVIVTIAVLYSFFAKVLVVHKIPDKNNRSVASKLKIPTFVAGEYITAVKCFSLQKTIENISYIRQADLRSKGIGANNMPEGEILKELIFKLLH